jgi:hypothetical protein
MKKMKTNMKSGSLCSRICGTLLGVAAVAMALSSACTSINVGQTNDGAGTQTASVETEKVEVNPSLSSAIPKPSPKPKLANAVCPDPASPCKHRDKEFGAWDMSFKLPTHIVPNKIYKSAPFYAIILKIDREGCEEFDYKPELENERLEIQKSYPNRKVFASYDCPNMDAVSYEFDGAMDKSGERYEISQFIAVYAGETMADATKLLEKTKRDFPESVLKHMTADWSRIDQ